MSITNKALHGTVHAVLALRIQSLALCIVMRSFLQLTEIGRRHDHQNAHANLKIGGPGLTCSDAMSNTVTLLRLVQIGVRVPVHP
jgi:hypothetical protein